MEKGQRDEGEDVVQKERQGRCAQHIPNILSGYPERSTGQDVEKHRSRDWKQSDGRIKPRIVEQGGDTHKKHPVQELTSRNKRMWEDILPNMPHIMGRQEEHYTQDWKNTQKPTRWNMKEMLCISTTKWNMMVKKQSTASSP